MYFDFIHRSLLTKFPRLSTVATGQSSCGSIAMNMYVYKVQKGLVHEPQFINTLDIMATDMRKAAKGEIKNVLEEEFDLSIAILQDMLIVTIVYIPN